MARAILFGECDSNDIRWRKNATPGVSFSTAEAGASLPAGWKNPPVVKGKPMTRYTFVFDGNKSKLSVFDRASTEVAQRLGGKDLPYATLMYVWSTTAPPGSVIATTLGSKK